MSSVRRLSTEQLKHGARLGEDADNDYYAKWAGKENPFKVLIDELGT